MAAKPRQQSAVAEINEVERWFRWTPTKGINMSNEKSNAFRFVKPMGYVALEDSSAHHLLTFLCLAARNDTGESWYGHVSIMQRTGLTKYAIRKASKKLVDLGVISCEVRSRQESKLYTVHYDKLLELAEQGKAGRDKFILAEREKRAASQRRRRQRCKDEIAGNVGVKIEPYKEGDVGVKSDNVGVKSDTL